MNSSKTNKYAFWDARRGRIYLPIEDLQRFDAEKKSGKGLVGEIVHNIVHMPRQMRAIAAAFASVIAKSGTLLRARST